jgi:hypothetical protein
MGLYMDIKGYTIENYGISTAGVIDEFAAEFNPEQHPIEFSERCVELFSIAIGKEPAKEKIKEYFKYLK